MSTALHVYLKAPHLIPNHTHFLLLPPPPCNPPPVKMPPQRKSLT